MVHSDARSHVTSVDVAREAGVSQATVARTFSSPAKVSAATKAKVRDAAERIGYVPNAIARSLKSQRTNIIGAVVPAYGEYWQGVVTGFSRRLAERDRQLLLFSFSEPEQVEAMLGAVQQYRLDGLILASATIGHEQLTAMSAAAMPLVAFNQPEASGVVNSVSVDNEAGMADMADHLADLGCRSVMFVGGIRTTSTDRNRHRGAANQLSARGVACHYIEAGAYSYEAGYKIASVIVDRPTSELPDAVMVASDEVAFGVLDGLQANGLSVPEDLLLTGFDGLPQARWARYDLTTLVQPISVLVDEAVDLLLAGTDGHNNEGHTGATAVPVEKVVDGVLRVGRTSGRAVAEVVGSGSGKK